MRTKDTILLEEAYASIFNEAAKKGKPDWLLASQLKAEGKKGNGNTKCPKCDCKIGKPKEGCKCKCDTKKVAEEMKTSKCPDCGCNPDKPKAGCKCKHKNKKMMKEEHEEQDHLSDPIIKRGMTIISQYKHEGFSDLEAVMRFKDLFQGAPEGPSQDDQYYTKLD
jgi:hypothetical protein